MHKQDTNLLSSSHFPDFLDLSHFPVDFYHFLVTALCMWRCSHKTRLKNKLLSKLSRIHITFSVLFLKTLLSCVLHHVIYLYYQLWATALQDNVNLAFVFWRRRWDFVELHKYAFIIGPKSQIKIFCLFFINITSSLPACLAYSCRRIFLFKCIQWKDDVQILSSYTVGILTVSELLFSELLKTVSFFFLNSIMSWVKDLN